MASIDDAEHFALFAKSVERAIAEYGRLPSEDMTILQKRQVEELSKLEIKFRKALIKDPNGESAYLAFLAYVLDDKKNILVARPYFRERRLFFKTDISNAVRTRDIKALQKFHVNYHFVQLVSKALVFGKDVNELIAKIGASRRELVEMNLPLVINRARIFYSRTPKSHLSFMDLVQIGTEGLMSAIDKYCGEYSKVWRGVAIGRMTGNYIENYSSTMLHFYPADKRKIYRANKFKSKHIHGDYNAEDLVKEVSKAEGNETDLEEITGLMAASAMVSADSAVSNSEIDSTVSDNIAKYEAPEQLRPDLQVEAHEANFLMQKAISKLSLFDRKLLKLKGVDIALE